MEIGDGQELPQGNAGDSSAPAPDDALSEPPWCGWCGGTCKCEMKSPGISHRLHQDVVAHHAARAEAAERQRDDLLATVKALSEDWKDRARRVRPLESARLTAAKRAAIAEWICLSNRATELDAIIDKAEGK
jgi:hypothetical protein